MKVEARRSLSEMFTHEDFDEWVENKPFASNLETLFYEIVYTFGFFIVKFTFFTVGSLQTLRKPFTVF